MQSIDDDDVPLDIQGVRADEALAPVRQYRRDFGQMRVQVELENGTLNYPEIPPRVFPLAKEIENDNVPDPTDIKQSGKLPAVPLLSSHARYNIAVGKEPL